MIGPDQNNNFKNDGYDSDYSEKNFPRKDRERGRFFWEFIGEFRLSEEEFNCKICKEALRDPVTTTCCNKNVCRQCFEYCRICVEIKRSKYGLRKKWCNWSKFFGRSSSVPNAIPCSKFFNRVLDSLHVRCIERDCQMEMKYKDLDEHWKEKCRRLIKCDHCSFESRLCDGHACTGSLNSSILKMKMVLEEQTEAIEEINERIRDDNRMGWNRGVW